VEKAFSPEALVPLIVEVNLDWIHFPLKNCLVEKVAATRSLRDQDSMLCIIALWRDDVSPT
jgi:hypothetical protein